MQLCGQAYTINAFEGDNGAIHAALAVIPENVVLVIDAGGFENRALWGGILNTVAMRRKVAGVVIDGAVRDSDELREHGLPVFAAAISPAGPSKGWAGTSTELFPAAMLRCSPVTLSSVMLTVLWLSLSTGSSSLRHSNRAAGDRKGCAGTG